MIKAGIVGCGAISSVHGRALAGMGNVSLRAAADIIPERAKKLTESYGGVPYSSLEEMLEKEELDVLHICTPHALHMPMAKLAAEKGIAVFSEKPPVISCSQWEELKAVAKRTPLGVCFQNRFNDNVIYTKNMLDNLGRFKGARAFLTWHRDEDYYKESGWRGTYALEGGGALINQAIHTLDLLTYFLGRPDSVEANIKNFHLKGTIEVEDTVSAYMSYGGKPVLFYGTTAYAVDSPVFIELVFEGATVKLTGERLEIARPGADFEVISFEKKDNSQRPAEKAYWGRSHEKCIAEFYKAINIENEMDIIKCTDTVELMLAIYESAKTGKIIGLK